MNEVVSQFAGPAVEAFKALLYLIVLLAAAFITDYLRRRCNIGLTAEQQARFEALAEQAIIATEQEWSKKALVGATTPVGILTQPAIHAEKKQNAVKHLLAAAAQEGIKRAPGLAGMAIEAVLGRLKKVL